MKGALCQLVTILLVLTACAAVGSWADEGVHVCVATDPGGCPEPKWTPPPAAPTFKLMDDKDAPGPALTITRGNAAKFDLKTTMVKKLTINGEGGERVVEVNLQTGKVKLFKAPNAAAKQFWKAVQLLGATAPCKEKP